MSRFAPLTAAWSQLADATREPTAEEVEAKRQELRGLILLGLAAAEAARQAGDVKRAKVLTAAVREACRPPWRK